MGVIRVFESSLVLLTFILLATADTFFVDNPPASFYNRKSIHDCADIFYSKRILKTCFVQGGKDAELGEFPHMAAIGWTSDGTTEYKCGGTLIASKYVLTAAHCALNANGKSPDTVRFGDTNLESTIGDRFVQQINIRAFKRHPNHRFKSKYFDIALIELESDVEFTKSVCPACLWLENDVPKSEMQSIGFGGSDIADRSPTLQKVSLSPIGKQECNERFSAQMRSLSSGIVDHQFCAGSSYKDTCQGDSGGPIQIEKEDLGSYVFPLVVGIVSFGSSCTNGSSGVYTRVADFREWIETCMSTTRHFRKEIDHGHCSYFIFHRVSLLWNISEPTNYQCTATVIDFQFAITSAFCVKKKQNFPKFIKIEETGETVEIDKIYIHPHYNPKHPENNLALLQLSKYLNKNEDLIPVCFENIDTSVAQWAEFAAYSSEKSSENVVHTYSTMVSGRILEQNRNNLFWAEHPYPLIPSICHLLHGGPIISDDVFDGNIRSRYLKGIVSNLSSGCDKSLVGIPISSAHVEWINNIVMEHSGERLIFT